jgi:hypothetical protein
MRFTRNVYQRFCAVGLLPETEIGLPTMASGEMPSQQQNMQHNQKEISQISGNSPLKENTNQQDHLGLNVSDTEKSRKRIRDKRHISFVKKNRRDARPSDSPPSRQTNSPNVASAPENGIRYQAGQDLIAEQAPGNDAVWRGPPELDPADWPSRLEREPPGCFGYVALVFREDAWIMPVQRQRFRVFKKDLPFLMLHEPKGTLNHTNIRNFREKVLRHYVDELSYLYERDIEVWKWRFAGLTTWVFHDLEYRTHALTSPSFGNSGLLDTNRKGAKAHDNLRFPTFSNQRIIAVITGLIVCCGQFLLGWNRTGSFSSIIAMMLVAWGYVRDPRVTADPSKYVGTFAMIRRFPIASAYIEEILKCIPGLWRVIGYFEYLKYGTWSCYHFHHHSMRYDFWQRLHMHKEWNTAVTAKKGPIYQAYCEAALTGSKLETQSGVVETLHYSGLLPSRPQSYGPNSEGALTFPEPLGTPPLIEEHRSGFYAVCWGVTPMFKPGSTESNKVSCTNARIINAPVTKCDLYALRRAQRVSESIVAALEHSPADPEAFFEHLRPVQKNCLKEATRAHFRDDVDTRITLFVKSNEILYDNGEKWVPRPVLNVSGHWFRTLGPEIWTLQSDYARRFDWDCDPIEFKTFGAFHVNVYLYFTCGATSSNLERFVSRAMSCCVPSVWLMVMGDDSFAILVDKESNRTFVETDFSKFDTSQNSQVLSLSEHLVASRGEPVAKAYSEMYKSDLFVRLDRKYKDLLAGDLQNHRNNMRITGEPGTCLCNSHVNACVSLSIYAHYVAECDLFSRSYLTPDRLKKKFQKYGLTVKAQAYTNFGPLEHMYPNSRYHAFPPLTFLKGVFLQRENGKILWMRLPSFLCKFGKAMTDPVLTDRRRITPQQKRASFLLSQLLGYGHLSTVTPHYREILDHFSNLADVHSSPSKLEEWQVRTSPTDAPLSTPYLWAFLQDRYGIDPVSWASCLRTLKSCRVFPCVWTHDVLDVLARRDYG